MKSKAVCVGVGIECFKCGQLTDKMKHEPGWTPKTGRAYLSYWYVCKTVTCPTININPRSAYVLPEPLEPVEVVFDIDVAPVSTLPISDANDPNPPW
jgi:hypothetical protein